ncbi:MAG: single-stranded DNA-binding protein [Tenericutes bacterium]|nr:single-stranded DNA-binding protein [Mycoplasmatota bacterium]
MNKIILVGRLTKDPELRSTTSGISTVAFSVAVNRNFKNKEGNYDADFINCVAFRNQAEFISKYFKKGGLIGIDGRIQTRNYDAEDGTKRYVTEVLVDSVEFVGGKNENSPSSPQYNNSYVDEPSAPPVDVMSEIDIPKSDPYENYDNEVSLSDNDLPF